MSNPEDTVNFDENMELSSMVRDIFDLSFLPVSDQAAQKSEDAEDLEFYDLQEVLEVVGEKKNEVDSLVGNLTDEVMDLPVVASTSEDFKEAEEFEFQEDQMQLQLQENERQEQDMGSNVDANLDENLVFDLNYLIWKELYPIKCPWSGCKSIIFNKNLSRHVQLVHKQLKSVCYKCGKVMINRDIARHLQLCTTEDRNVKCSHEGCPKTFKTNHQRTWHALKVHRPPVKCPHEGCNKNLRPSYLKMHIKSVHQNFQVVCVVCKKLVSFRNYNQHKSRCQGKEKRKIMVSSKKRNNPIGCPIEGCDVSTSPFGLKNHILEHHHESRVTCPNCGRDTGACYFVKHLQICTSNGEKKYNCPVAGCRAAFVTTHHLAGHKRKVHRQPIKCPHEGCEKFVKPDCLANHVTRLHRNLTTKCNFCGENVAANYLKLHTKKCNALKK